MSHMSQVTTNIELQIAELRRKLRGLVDHRNEQIANARTMIELVNQEFDELARDINREINHLEGMLPNAEPVPAPKPTRTRKAKQPTGITVEDGYTPEEVAHYNRLKTKRG